MKIAPSGGQISTFFTSSPPNGQKIPPTNFCHTQCSFAEENFEFEPLSQANLDTHYPPPKPTALNEQMGAYPPTQKGSGEKPWARRRSGSSKLQMFEAVFPKSYESLVGMSCTTSSWCFTLSPFPLRNFCFFSFMYRVE